MQRGDLKKYGHRRVRVQVGGFRRRRPGAHAELRRVRQQADALAGLYRTARPVVRVGVDKHAAAAGADRQLLQLALQRGNLHLLLAPFAFGQSQFRTGVRVFNRLLRRLMHIDGGGRQLRLSNGETVF